MTHIYYFILHSAKKNQAKGQNQTPARKLLLYLYEQSLLSRLLPRPPRVGVRGHDGCRIVLFIPSSWPSTVKRHRGLPKRRDGSENRAASFTVFIAIELPVYPYNQNLTAHQDYVNRAAAINNIYILLYCLVFITSSSLADNVDTDLCSEYSQINENPDIPPAPSDNIPYWTGLLWKIENTSVGINYLFGTMHSQDRLINRLPPPVRLALAQSRILVMEVVPDQEANRIFLDSIFFRGQEQLKDLLDASVYSRLQNQITDYGISREDVSRIKPWAAFTLIGRPKPVRAATLDEALMQTADSLNKAIYGLETMHELVGSLDSISMEDQIEILNDTVCNHARIVSDTWQLVQLYMERDLAGIERFNKQPHHDEAVFDRFMQRILYDRNLHMLERMDSYLSNGKAFIAVGATHLSGEEGILNGLKKKGYRISVVY
ncbi:MAG: TraB/GumN family protein [Gammaproteobacteria bacterium]